MTGAAAAAAALAVALAGIALTVALAGITRGKECLGVLGLKGVDQPWTFVQWKQAENRDWSCKGSNHEDSERRGSGKLHVGLTCEFAW